MTEEARRQDKMLGLCLLAVALFNPPLLDIFSGGALGDWPLLYVYLFAAWAIVIVLIGVVVERRRRATGGVETED